MCTKQLCGCTCFHRRRRLLTWFSLSRVGEADTFGTRLPWKRLTRSNEVSTCVEMDERGKKVYACRYEGCGKVYSKPCRMEEHLRSHTGEVSSVRTE
ncbi:hypothetical protein PORY_002003 [Pneumocystis oryctolagi]|uniref:Uncharacterized protein n=1 Tax=Pneumocystis oryctolagi TaxID=42067 RepID=A0ACB7CAV8_9ASCO|nr:hypothetical protein PORY_002003 [Pneumocystis oryctolagi]